MSSTATTTQTQTLKVQGDLSGPIATKLSFYSPPADGSKPHYWVDKPADGRPQQNFSTIDHTVTINDIRGRESNFSLKRNAFAALKNTTTSPAVNFSSDDSIREKYYPEVEELLRQHLNAADGTPIKRVILFDHTTRRADPAAHRGPVMRVHIDQTPYSAAQRVRLHVGGDPNSDSEDVRAALADRYRIINVWRPLNGNVESFPLAVADSNSAPSEVLVPIEHRYPDRTGETAGIRHHDDMQWYYLSSMGNDERLLLQCFDTSAESRVPHTAFVDPRSTEKSKPRESIEVRALVLG